MDIVCNGLREACQFMFRVPNPDWDPLCTQHKACERIDQECATAGTVDPSKPLPCSKVDNGVCTAYLWPSTKWRTRCALAASPERADENAKKVNPLKASKRAAKGK